MLDIGRFDRGASTAVAAPPASDEELVRRCLDGERRAFEVLVRRHQRGLVNHLYRLTGRRETALDLAQDAFIKVYQSLASFDPRYRFTTWLYRIASNCAIDLLRRKEPALCPLGGERGEEERAPARAGALAGRGPSPLEVLRFRELRARVESSLATLPAPYRELLLLRHHRHCRYDEIARITGLPLGTVKNRIFRAREMLRHELSDLLPSEA